MQHLVVVPARVLHDMLEELADNLEQLASRSLTRGEHRDFNVTAHQQHGRNEHGHGPRLPSSPRHDDQRFLLQLGQAKLVQDALLIVLPFVLIDLGQTRSYVHLVQLALLLGSDNPLPLVILEPVFQKVSNTLYANVALELTVLQRSWLRSDAAFGNNLALFFFLFANVFKISQQSLVHHPRRVQHHVLLGNPVHIRGHSLQTLWYDVLLGQNGKTKIKSQKRTKKSYTKEVCVVVNE